MNCKDRCDNCGAQAFVIVNLPADGGKLLFCGHDFARNKAALEAIGAHVDDSALEALKNPPKLELADA